MSQDGVAALQEHGCDFIISLGGVSPQDAACCVSIVLQMVEKTTGLWRAS